MPARFVDWVGENPVRRAFTVSCVWTRESSAQLPDRTQLSDPTSHANERSNLWISSERKSSPSAALDLLSPKRAKGAQK
jgi:hypothetical protein